MERYSRLLACVRCGQKNCHSSFRGQGSYQSSLEASPPHCLLALSPSLCLNVCVWIGLFLCKFFCQPSQQQPVPCLNIDQRINGAASHAAPLLSHGVTAAIITSGGKLQSQHVAALESSQMEVHPLWVNCWSPMATLHSCQTKCQLQNETSRRTRRAQVLAKHHNSGLFLAIVW